MLRQSRLAVKSYDSLRSAEAAPQLYYMFGLYPVNIAKVSIYGGVILIGEEAGAAYL